MLISRVSEDTSGAGGREGSAARLGDSHEYQTANELFELMAKNHPFDHDVGDTLSASDLVILYKNIEIGTKLMSNVDELKCSAPNQYVGTIVYNDEPESESSEASDNYTGEDLRYVFSINKERIDLLSNPPSLENTLCHKFGDLEMQTSNVSTVYDKHFLFKDPYIKEQLKSLSALNSSSNEFDGTVLPASLLDYICCKRLEDNYNFYMDNIIRYVNHTIEQLKRISNGDYLTEKAKEKWKEVESAAKDGEINNTKVLATSTSIPLQVERKANGRTSTWDEIIHSEVDIRSLSKILEKKIVVEVPKLICGSYKLFSKLCSDNLVVSCKREHQPINTTEKKESRVDVVLQLGRSESGQVISNISSIMILQANLPTQLDESTGTALMPVPFFEVRKSEDDKQTAKIVEIKEANDEDAEDEKEDAEFDEAQDLKDEGVAENRKKHRKTVTHDTSLTTDHEDDDNENENHHSKNTSFFESGDSCVAMKDILDTRAVPNVLRKEAPFNFISPDDLTLSMHKLNMSSLAEESGEEIIAINKKPPSKIRVKSPYENKSYLIEERKRKRLLEIRERREKKKIAMSENCKIMKHRYGKGPITPQASSSVTKLSITNKSFYNSIYGQNPHCIERQSTKCNSRKGRRDLAIENALEQSGDEQGTQILTPEINSKKYVNRSYYLDDAVTEMMYTQQSDCSSEVKELYSVSTSMVSNDLGANLNILSNILNTPKTHSKINSPSDVREEREETNELIDIRKEGTCNKIVISESTHNMVPSNTPKNDDFCKENLKRSSSIECRKSIDKIYDLMKKLGNIKTLECNLSRTKFSSTDLNFKTKATELNKTDTKVCQDSSTIQCSDSGTSLKHHLTSSSPSSFSFEKVLNAEDVFTLKKVGNKKADALANVVPKVIISTKHQAMKSDIEKLKKERRKFLVNPPKVSDNPLKAISQLLHEFDSVQKTRQKTPTGPKIGTKAEVSFDAHTVLRPSSLKRRSRLDYQQRKYIKDEIPNEKNVKVSHLRDRRSRPVFPPEPLKLHQQISNEDKYIDRSARKKLADVIDEEKEAKGEAVKGPSKLTSRLNSLAQPKKSYVQAHSEEYKTKYGRTLMADRLQRLAATAAVERPAGSARRRRADAAPAARQQPPALPPLGVGANYRRSSSASPVGKLDAPSYAGCHTPSAPETLKNKMVAVETYVKSHYGRAAPAAGGEAAARGAGKARVPLVPHNLDLASVPSSPGEESTAIGSKLHRIINSMMSAKPVALAALTESRESCSKHSKDGDDESLAAKQSHDEPSSVDSDYRVDIFEDKHVKTAVQNFPEGKHEESVTDEMSERSNAVKCDDVHIYKSTTELQQLEKALHRRLPVGTFQKRLRIKNLTITPKQSVQQVFLLQSGDAGSIVLKSTMSKSLKFSSSQSDFTTNVETLPSLTSPQMDWNVTSIPMQITTIGYAFPRYDPAQSDSKPHIKSLHDIFKGLSETSIKNKIIADKVYQSLKELPKTKLTQDMQTNAMPSDINDAVAEHAPVPKEAQPTTATVTATHQKAVASNHALKEMSTVINKSIDKVGDLNMDTNIENIDCTSSLDMLVGLLNEIQKITACHISNTEIGADEKECEQLERMLLNNNNPFESVAEYNDSHELVSISSLDKLRQLESSASIYSLYISNDESEPIGDTTADIPNTVTSTKSVLCKKPSCVDKEVSADLPDDKVFINTFTDTQSKLFPVTIAHSTNVTNSLLGILSKPSTQTMFSFKDCETIYSDSSFKCQKKIIELSEPSLLKISKRPLVAYPETVEDRVTIVTTKRMINEIEKDRSESISFKNKHELLKSKCCVKSSDFDPLLKMKRDILVTVYSMLVLTVFAALSLPEMLYYA